jgi:hypothetical protein
MYMGWNRIEYDAMGWNWIDGIGSIWVHRYQAASAYIT